MGVTTLLALMDDRFPWGLVPNRRCRLVARARNNERSKDRKRKMKLWEGWGCLAGWRTNIVRSFCFVLSCTLGSY